jgi:iron complex outermembrane receptor protein
MLYSRVLLASTSALAVLVAAPAAAQQTSTSPDNPASAAQQSPASSTSGTATTTAPAEADNPENAIVVTGIRKSLQSAQSLKKNSRQQVDAIVAEDIGKLPDIATSETAARIPGVQVTRRNGEADSVLVRGLPDFATTYNGREIFTAETRVVALQDFPSANIAALEVYKTTTANLVEAGLAGLINVRSRRPFDFKGLEIGGTAYTLYPRQSGKVTPNGNLLVSDRWKVGDGEMGALVNVSFTKLEYLDSSVSNTDFIADPTVGAQRIRVPDIQRLTYNAGERDRPSVNAAFQWRPTPNIELYAEGLYQGFRNRIANRELSVPLYGGQFSNLTFRDQTNLVAGGTVTNPRAPYGFQGATFNKTDTYQFAVGGSWDSGPLKLSADLARTRSKFTGSTESIDSVFANSQTVDFNSGTGAGSGNGPNFQFRNFDPSNPANYIFAGLYEEAQVSSGKDWQGRIDGEYETGLSLLPKLEFGIRYSDRDAHREFGNRYSNFESRRIPVTAVPIDYQLFRAGFRGSDLQPGFQKYLSPTYDSVRADLGGFRQYIINLGARDFGFGTYTVGAVAPDPQQIYDANEKSSSAYAQLNYQFGEAVDGVLGIRAVRTQDRLNGTSLVVPTSGGPAAYTPVAVRNKYTDWLPNASLRWHLTPQVQLRLSATKTRTRPTFGDLNPSANLGAPPSGCTPDSANPFNCARGGGGGNPFLRPFTSRNYDASLEYYFSRSGFAAADVFRRDLKGFIQNNTVRYIDPVLGPLVLNGPVNTRSGRITGAEAQITTFFDWAWVPDFLHSFGAQANVTYLKTRVDDPIAADIQSHQIFGVSKWTYNLVGIYEHGPLSVRLSYNKRSKTLDTIQNRGDDSYIEYGHPAGRLDLSTNFNVTPRFTVFFDWTNILNKPFREDFSSARAGAPRAEYTRFYRIEEEIFSGGIRFRLGK